MQSLLSNRPSRKPHTENFLRRTIRNKLFDSAIEAITRCHKTSGLKPKSMLLLGESGAGKSTIVNTYRRSYSEIELDDRTLTPILYISLQPRVTVNDMLSWLLEACGDPEFDKGTTRSLLNRLYGLIKSLGVQLIIIDEIQHVLPEHTHRRTQEAADMIKSITDRSGVPFILTGLPHGSRLLTDSIRGKHNEDQLIRRFNSTFHISPPALGSNAWKNLMRGYQDACGAPCINLTSDEMLKRFHLATHGLHGFIANILEHALDATDGEEQILLTHLASAWGIMAPSIGLTENPFTLSMTRVDKALNMRQSASE